jgi:creatinine amidohydrolase
VVPDRTRKLADMTWQEVRTWLEGSDALILPIGTCEQHGPHLPLSTDTLIAEAFAAGIARETGIPLAPTLEYGVNLPCDRFVPGTAGFSFDGLREGLGSLLADWSRYGFRRFFLVTAHGCATDGYGFAHHEAIKQAALPLLEANVCEVFVVFPYWVETGDLLTHQTGVEHAGEVETSLALHLFPERVRKERIPESGAEEQEERFRAYPEGVGTGPPADGWTGAEGHPGAATAAKGAAIFERCLESMTRFVKGTMGEGSS